MRLKGVFRSAGPIKLFWSRSSESFEASFYFPIFFLFFLFYFPARADPDWCPCWKG